MYASPSEGLSPGLNNVIRALVNALHFRYQVKKVLGFRYGLQGLTPDTRFPPVELTPNQLTNIHTMGGTYLGTLPSFVDRWQGGAQTKI